MSSENPAIGSVGWHDLTVSNADQLKDFYQRVIGWAAEPQSMGDYADYVMQAADGTPTAGVCHARGPNADLPAQWLIYFIVEDLDRSLQEVTAGGGSVIAGPTVIANSRFCVISDPAGAVCALYERTP